MATRRRNPWSKARSIDNPYVTITSPFYPDWEWRVLKTYQEPMAESANPLARWFCAVKSPFTFGSFDWGDTYIKDIPEGWTFAMLRPRE